MISDGPVGCSAGSCPPSRSRSHIGPAHPAGAKGARSRALRLVNRGATAGSNGANSVYFLESFQGLTRSQIMWPPSASPNVSGATPFQEISAAGRWQGVELGKQEGRQEVRELALEEGRRREACTLALRLLEHRCGSLIAATTPRIEALSRAQPEKKLTLALLDFRSGEDLHV